jgi:hypothetical protein
MRDGDTIVRWSRLGSGMEVNGRGEVVFNDDLTDVESLSPRGYFTLREWWMFVPHTIEIRTERGKLTHRYFVAGLSRPYDDKARKWLAETLTGLVRRSALGAGTRTRQILAARGVAGVLDEIRQLDGDFVRGVYFRQLFNATRLDASTLTKALSLASDVISSDFELSRILRAAAPMAAIDAATAKAYISAANQISSDFEHQRVLVALSHVEGAIPRAGELIAQSVRRMSSDFEKGRVLRDLIAHRGLSLSAQRAVLDAVSTMSSDFEQARVLRAMIAAAPPLDPSLRRAFLRAADRLGSSLEQNRVLAAYVKSQR